MFTEQVVVSIQLYTPSVPCMIAYIVVFVFCFVYHCVSIVIVLRSLYRAAVSALFSLVLLLVKLHVVRFTFEQIKKKEGIGNRNSLL